MGFGRFLFDDPGSQEFLCVPCLYMSFWHLEADCSRLCRNASEAVVRAEAQMLALDGPPQPTVFKR